MHHHISGKGHDALQRNIEYHENYMGTCSDMSVVLQPVKGAYSVNFTKINVKDTIYPRNPFPPPQTVFCKYTTRIDVPRGPSDLCKRHSTVSSTLHMFIKQWVTDNWRSIITTYVFFLKVTLNFNPDLHLIL